MDDDRLLASPTPLAEPVSYQTGSVVSRARFRNKVTVGRDDQLVREPAPSP